MVSSHESKFFEQTWGTIHQLNSMQIVMIVMVCASRSIAHLPSAAGSTLFPLFAGLTQQSPACLAISTFRNFVQVVYCCVYCGVYCDVYNWVVCTTVHQVGTQSVHIKDPFFLMHSNQSLVTQHVHALFPWQKQRRDNFNDQTLSGWYLFGH